MAYFSIIIPTRNRPEIVTNAVASVLRQSFVDFELIVSDNSNADQASKNQRVLSEALSDPRVRYIRPDSTMSMVDHWEWAVRHVNGDFTGILTDRMTLRSYALDMLHKTLKDSGTDLIVYAHDILIGDRPPYRIKPARHNLRTNIISSKAILADCARAKISGRLPRMLNSFCNTQRLRELVTQYGSVFSGLAPDYSFCFRILDQLDSFVSLNCPLLLMTHEGLSNGIAFKYDRSNEASREYLSLYGDAAPSFDYAPIPEMGGGLNNGIYQEYEFARQRQRSGRLLPLDPELFYRRTYKQLRSIAKQLSNSGRYFQLLESYREKHNLTRRFIILDSVSLAYKQARSSVHSLLEKITQKESTQEFSSVLDALEFDFHKARSGEIEGRIGARLPMSDLRDRSRA
jgi:hypothetical protein